MLANHGIQAHVAVQEISVDFAINAIETGAAERTAESTAQNSRVNEGVVLDTNQAVGDRRNAIRRDGVVNNNIFSCLVVQNNFNLPDVSSVTPINVDNLTLQLCNHPDRHKVDYVLSGLRHGFRLGFHPESTHLKSAKANCPSALKQPSIIDEYLAKEVSLGRVFGHTAIPPIESLQVSRFGVIPKKDGGWRLILDLSFPFGHSVNDGINKEEFTLTYSKVSDAI